MNLTKLAVAAPLVLALAAPVALAHSGATGIVKERMDAMESMGRASKGIWRAIRGNGTLDRPAIAAAAQRISEQSLEMLRLFPPGSHQRPSRARPAIWSQWEDFAASARDLETVSAALAEHAAAADRDGLAAHFDRMARVCVSCHRAFRKSRRELD